MFTILLFYYVDFVAPSTHVVTYEKCETMACVEYVLKQADKDPNIYMYEVIEKDGKIGTMYQPFGEFIIKKIKT